MKEKWFQRSYRRNLLDMHIPDWDERFLSEFDPKKYVDMLALANVRSAMFYANSHVGNCYWPTKIGHMHKGLKGRDILGEVIDLCHQKRMDAIVYYSLIFNNWAYENHPEWRIITAEGKEAKGLGSGRYGICCPNSSHRDFVVAQIEELCKNYEFEGMWFDMTLWPDVCYCPACRKRYLLEVGKELPKIINWEKPGWVKFQRKREQWLADFAALVTSTAKKAKPTATVVHQANGFVWDWKMGASLDLAKASDFIAADFYLDSLQESFFSKLFYNLSENLPFEFMTSCIDPNLRDHTGAKSKELLEVQIYAALANGGAFVFIDAIDPVGTLNKKVYEQMGEIFKETQRYEKYLGGKYCQDIGIYLSFESRIGLENNGKKVSDVASSLIGIRNRKVFPHSRAALSASKSLLNSNIPFGVITKKNLKEFSSRQIIILPNVLMMDEEEAQTLKDFVASGGSLYASKNTSLFTKDGGRREDFLLSDLFGASYIEETKEEVTYISPVEEGKDILSPFSAKYPLSIPGSQLKVKARKGAKILATITLPYTDPKDPTRFTSIHSNPPGVPTEYPSMVLNNYGKGKVLYVAADLEVVGKEAHRIVFINLIKLLSSKPFTLEADAPKSVEVTFFHQEDKKRYLINLLNSQKELPNIPVEGIKVRVRLEGKEPQRLIKLPEEKELAYETKDGYVEFTLPKLETFLMIALDYE